MTAKHTIYSLLPLPLFVLCFLYIVVFVLATRRAFKFSFNLKQGLIGKFFYISISLQTLIRGILFLLIGILLIVDFTESESKSSLAKFFVNIVYIPEFIIWISFVLLYWQYVILLYIGHINFSNNERFKIPIPLRKKSSIIFILFIIFIILVESIIMFLYDFEVIGFAFLLIEDIVINFLLPFLFINCQLFLHLKFSGAPYLSKIYHEKKNKFSKILLLWVFCRICQAVLSIVAKVENDVLIYQNFLEGDNSSDAERIGLIVVFFIDHFLTEVVPSAVAMDKDLMKIFNMNVDEDNLCDLNLLILNESSDPFKTYDGHLKEKLFRREEKRISLRQIDFEKIVYDDQAVPTKPAGKLGFIRKGTYNKEQNLAIRTIAIKDVSNFIFDEIDIDINQLLTLNSPFIVPVRSRFSDENTILLASEYIADESLEKYLLKNSSSKEINSHNEINYTIGHELAKTMKQIHEYNIIHGHLTPANIFISENHTVKITDYLLFGLKKICSIKISYSNKTKYSPPEILKEKSIIAKNLKKSSDVYSFAIILWELLERKQPFGKISLKELLENVVEKKNRPKISNDIPNEISQLIRACWQEDETKRPDFNVIENILSSFIE